MCRYLYSFFLGLSLVCFSKIIHGQTYPFINYNVESGLSQAQVLCAFQNDDGVMWFGTSGGGITKYDGNSFEYITDRDGLADNVVYCIVKDKKGRILIGTNNGLSIYEPYLKLKVGKKRFRNYTTKNGLSHNRIFTIMLDGNDKIILGTGQGISVLKDTTITILEAGEALNHASVFHIMKDSKNELWCSTLGSGVFNFNGKAIKSYSRKDGLENYMVFSVLEKSKGIFWFLTGEGIFELNNQKIKEVILPSLNKTIGYYSYLQAKDSVLWIASSHGALRFEANGAVKKFNAQNGLVNNSIWKIFQDKETNIWLTSDQNGVSKLSSERFSMFTTKDGLLNNEIKQIYVDKSGSLLIGSKLGLSIYNGENNIKNYTTIDFKGTADIWAISSDGKGGYLIGTGNGLVLFNGKTFKRIICKDSESQMNVIYAIWLDNKGEIWLGTQAGVAKVKNGKIQAFTETEITKSIVLEIYQDVKGIFWFGTNEGLYKYDGKVVKHFTENDGITQKEVNAIISDKNHNLWISTFDGIFYLNNNKFSRISDADGLASNEVYSIAFDKNNNLWAGLTNGIDRIKMTGNSYKIRHYGTADGFIGQECNLNGISVGLNGNLLVGTSKGLMIYKEKYDIDNQLPPITKIKSIDLFFQKTDWKSYADSLDLNKLPYNLSLPYNKNYLTFNFIGVSLTAPTKVAYKYMLKGVDKDWRLSKKTDVTYSNIPPGNYEFLLKATNGEGIWNAEPITFKFTISPPFWKSWWFYSIIALIIISMMYSYMKIRTANSKILQQNGIIAEKNSALSHANIEIAEKNQNITDSINYAKRIQRSFLTADSVISNALNDYFILYKPRDIVSGDFYLTFDFPDRTIIICSDCTGHGIPGAFMSLISISLLNEIFRSKELLEPAKILDELRRNIIQALNPDSNEDGGKDGMDVSIISIFKNTNTDEITINFAGANNALHLVTAHDQSNLMKEIKGDNQPVGYFTKMKPFTNHEISAHRGDIIYLYTDGYADQFGGIKGKKFMTKQLKQTLQSICSMPMQEQKNYMYNKYREWQGDLEQVDDVTVIGIKL